MRPLLATLAFALTLVLTLAGCAHHPSGDGWITLIDGGSGLERFDRIGGANWHAADGAILADRSTTKGASILVSKRSFRDFELHAEFWADHDTNSGIYIRCTDPAKVSSASAYEVQIWDRNPNPELGTGALLPVGKVPPIHKAGGRWNTYEVRAKGNRITVKLNGVVTVDLEDGRYPAGPIGLQQNAGVIKWRKLLVREL